MAVRVSRITSATYSRDCSQSRSRTRWNQATFVTSRSGWIASNAPRATSFRRGQVMAKRCPGGKMCYEDCVTGCEQHERVFKGPDCPEIKLGKPCPHPPFRDRCDCKGQTETVTVYDASMINPYALGNYLFQNYGISDNNVSRDRSVLNSYCEYRLGKPCPQGFPLSLMPEAKAAYIANNTSDQGNKWNSYWSNNTDIKDNIAIENAVPGAGLRFVSDSSSKIDIIQNSQVQSTVKKILVQNVRNNYNVNNTESKNKLTRLMLTNPHATIGGIIPLIFFLDSDSLEYAKSFPKYRSSAKFQTYEKSGRLYWKRNIGDTASYLTNINIEYLGYKNQNILLPMFNVSYTMNNYVINTNGNPVHNIVSANSSDKALYARANIMGTAKHYEVDKD